MCSDEFNRTFKIEAAKLARTEYDVSLSLLYVRIILIIFALY